MYIYFLLKEENNKVGDKMKEQIRPTTNKKVLALLFKPASPTPSNRGSS